MENLFYAHVDRAVVLVAANEEFPSAPELPAAAPKKDTREVRGWSAYVIWHSRIRRRPGMRSLFLPHT